MRAMSTPPPLPNFSGEPLAPINPVKRIATLDILRGIALLGILISNMMHFSQPLEEGLLRHGMWLGAADQLADWICVFLVEGKFYPLFSFLFGMGFSLQIEHANAIGSDFTKTFRRRLFALMGFGIAHGIFLWDGDVLFSYAVSGFLLLLFRNRNPKTIAIWAVIAIVLPALLVLGVGLLIMLLANIPEFSHEMRELFAEGTEKDGAMTRAYISGDYADAIAYRIGEWPSTMIDSLPFFQGYFGLFLIGFLAGRKRILHEVTTHKTLLKKIFWRGLSVGLIGNFFGTLAIMSGAADRNIGLLFIGFGCHTIFGPLLTAAYAAGIVLFVQGKECSTILRPIAAAGRMALTHYLLQSLIATTIFYGYGFGMAGDVGRLGTIALALMIFIAQVFISTYWLKHFRYGPAEWLWRSITYAKRQPMRFHE